VPVDLRVVMRMEIDRARRDDLAGSIDFFLRFCSDVAADLGDLAVVHGEVGAIRRQSAAVHDGAVANDQIVLNHKPSLLILHSFPQNPTTTSLSEVEPVLPLASP